MQYSQRAGSALDLPVMDARSVRPPPRSYFLHWEWMADRLLALYWMEHRASMEALAPGVPGHSTATYSERSWLLFTIQMDSAMTWT